MSKFKKVISLVLCLAMLAGTFTTLGAVAPVASAADVKSNVKSFAEVDAAYDNYVYFGVDVYEVANGELTDGYVQPGDWLEYRITVLSDMYVSSTAPHLMFSKDFFDVRVVSSTTPKDHDNYTNNDYEGNIKYNDGFNPDHPYATVNQTGITHTVTAFPATKQSSQMGFCGFDTDACAKWDVVKSNMAITASVFNSNVPMTADMWYQSFYVRVKTGLADGATGQSWSPASIWKNNPGLQAGKGDTRRFADVATANVQGAYSSSKSLTERMNEVTLLIEDMTHTFTIGDGAAPVEKKAVKFQKLDGTVIATAEYAEGETVEVPAVDGLVAWTENAKAVTLGESFVMGQKALTYTAVLDTDKFDVTIDLLGGAYADDAVLPEGAEVVNGKLVLKAGFGETVDLTAVPVPEKAGYTGAWAATSVTVDSTRGATAAIKWAVATYAAKFFLDKEAFEGGAAAAKEITFVYGNKIPFANVTVTKEDVKFAGWIDAATGEPANAETIYADNMNFYADWTDYNASATIWGMDYATGEWVAVATKKADAGAVITINNLKALVNEANFGSAAVTYAFATLTADRVGTRVSNDGYTMVEGADNNIYIQTNVTYTYTVAVPEFDAEGYITDTCASETKTTTATTINLAAPADKTGYKFVAWADAEGNEYAAGNIAFDFANGTEYTFTAVYEEVEYTIELVVNKDSTYKQIIKVDTTFVVGDTFTLSEMTFVDAEGNETGLPEIDVNNEDQTYGPYNGVDGYKFKGWLAGAMASALSDYDITQEVTLTPAVLDAVTYSDVITIRGTWEARYFNFIAYYADSYDAEGNLVYKAMTPIAVKTGASITDAIAAAAEVAGAALPEGKRLTKNWKLADGSARPSAMPAGDLEIYATYANKSLNLYIDYNNSTEDAPLTLEETMFQSMQFSGFLYYDTDIENDIPEGELAPLAEMVRMAGVSEVNTPGATFELVGWNIFYVENEDDVYNKEMWKEGISDVAGSTRAKYTLIFQADWMAHKDFLFRVYNNEGALRSAIDKKFQKHFWYNNNPVAKEKAVELNTLPDSLIIFGFMPKFEFTDGFAVRIDPITISKAWLNPANWGALLEALFNGISSGFGGAI